MCVPQSPKMPHSCPGLEAGLNIQARARPGAVTIRPGPVNTFETPTNRQKMNSNLTLFVLHLSKHRPHSARPGSNSADAEKVHNNIIPNVKIEKRHYLKNDRIRQELSRLNEILFTWCQRFN